MLAKLNPANGAIVWKQIIGGTEDDNGLNLKIDAANNLYLVGNFASPEITFPSGDTFTNALDPNDSEGVSTNTFIAQFDVNGDNLWTENLGGANDVGVSQIAVSGAGEIFMTGYFFDSVTFGDITLFETEGAGETDEASLGGYIAKIDANGDFVWAKEFGGVGASLALDGANRVYVAGTFYDGGTFGAGEANEESLASFGGVDLFAARYDANGNFDFAKAVSGAGAEGGVAVSNPSAPDRKTENNYNPLGLAYNPARGTMFISGDFQTAVSLDCQTLNIVNGIRHSYLAELSADDETTSCRIWNGLDPNVNDWDSSDNWNGGTVPGDYDSVYVPYTGYGFDNPTYNPNGFGVILSNLTVADDRTLSLERDLPITGKLWLFGGIVDTGADHLLDLTETATTNRIADVNGGGGYVIGKLRKMFGDSLAPFIFTVGTASGYSPLDVAPQSGFGGGLAVKAVESAHPNVPNQQIHLNRYWTLNNAGEGFLSANLTFHYLQTDVVGGESQFRLFKIEPPDAPELQTATIDTEANTATVADVSQFSDWTLSAFAPTAATAAVGGRVTTAASRPVSQARVTLANSHGATRTALTNALGFYRFADVPTGETYVFGVSYKRLNFAAPTRVQNVTGEMNDVNFKALP